MTQNLSPAFLVKVFNVNNKLGGANGYFIDGYSDLKINKNVLAAICSNAIDKLHNAINNENQNHNNIDIHRILSLSEFESFEKVDFSLVVDKFKVLENCTDFLTNKLVDAILNNPTVDEETKVFFLKNSDYDLIYIDKLPQQYMQLIYDANIDSALNVDKKLQYGEHYIATQIISNIISNQQHGFPYAVDLMKRVLQFDFNPTRLGVSSLPTLIRCTNDKELIRALYNEIVNLSERTDWFYYFANNKNTPPDILNEIFNKYTNIPISSNEKNALLSCAYSLKLTDDQCYALSKIALIGNEQATKNTFDLTFNTECRIQLLLNETTPIEILKEIENEKNYTDSVITAYGTSAKIKDVVELDKICRKNNLERKKDLFDFFIHSNGKFNLFDISTDISNEDLLFLKEVKDLLEKETTSISFDANPIIWEIHETISNKIDSIETEKGRLEKQLYEAELEFNHLLQNTVRRFQLYINYDKIVNLYEKRLSLTSALESIEQISKNQETCHPEFDIAHNSDNLR